VTPTLYHFSEDPAIERFVPHAAGTSDVEQALVWAVDAEHAHIYYFPRQCPRVTYYASSRTAPEDVEHFFAHTTAARVVAIEAGWLEAMRSTKLHRYAFAAGGFEIRDETAGYWTSRGEVRPLSVEPVGDLLTALTAAGCEVRVMPSLWDLRDAVIASALEFSIIRWRNATARPEALR
jgi:hypothetical protein